MESYDVLLDGVKVDGRIVAFDFVEGWVDLYETNGGMGIVLDDDLRPIIVRRVGVVTVTPA